MDEDPASYKGWISRKEIESAKILRSKNEPSPKNTAKLIRTTCIVFSLQYLFRFTDVTELVTGITNIV